MVLFKDIKPEDAGKHNTLTVDVGRRSVLKKRTRSANGCGKGVLLAIFSKPSETPQNPDWLFYIVDIYRLITQFLLGIVSYSNYTNPY